MATTTTTTQTTNPIAQFASGAGSGGAYTSDQIKAAYESLFGSAKFGPAGNAQFLNNPNLSLDPSDLPYASIMNPQGQAMSLSQLFALASAQANAQANATGSAGTGAATGGTGLSSYYMPMTNYGQGGSVQSWGDGSTQGWGGNGSTGGGGNMATTTTATQLPQGASVPSWQTWYGQNVGKTILVNGQLRTIGQDIGADDVLSAYRNNTIGWGQTPGPQSSTQTVGGAGQLQPEQVALQQMAQTDPATEALRQQLSQSYATSLGQAQTPTASQFQSYLNLAKQVDPTTAAARQQLGTDLAAQEAQGTALDPATQRQIEQQTRIAQIARGNVYGTPQLVQEAMTTGQAGLALQQQRQQALQSYLTSGATPGDVAMNLYNQQQNQLRANQSSALSYLGSGSTPYQAGSSYVQLANQNAANAAQGGPSYNTGAQSPSQYYTGGGASSFPQYGTDMSQLAGNWYNNMNAANLQAYGLSGAGQGTNKGASAASGALQGAASGALTGAATGPWGALIGAGVGAVAGGAKGYFS